MLTVVFRVLGMLTVVAIGILSLVPAQARPQVAWPGSLEHAAAYFVATTLLGFGFLHPARVGHPVGGPDSARMLNIVLLLAVYGGLLEAVQQFVPGRTPSVLDWSANMLGVWLGAGLVWLLRGVVPGTLR